MALGSRTVAKTTPKEITAKLSLQTDAEYQYRKVLKNLLQISFLKSYLRMMLYWVMKLLYGIGFNASYLLFCRRGLVQSSVKTVSIVKLHLEFI